MAKLSQLREVTPSGGRAVFAAYNKKIGGATFSQHIYDLHPSTVAADLTFARGRPSEWADAAEPLCANGGLVRYPGFVHVDNRGTRSRWSG